MIRVLLYLVVVALLAFGAVWMAERPGDVAITWQGRRIETSVIVAIAAVAQDTSETEGSDGFLMNLLERRLSTPTRQIRLHGVTGALSSNSG